LTHYNTKTIVKKNLLNESRNLGALLKKSKNVLILSHYNPDGDAIGSLLAMFHYLVKKGFKTSAVVPNDYPEFLFWMKGTKDIVVFYNNCQKVADLVKNADVIICVDFNDFERIKGLGPLLLASQAKKVLIDHHPNPNGNFLIKIHDTSVSSTAELIYDYIIKTGDKKLLDITIGECIFAGIMTDTGCFSFNSSSPSTYRIVSGLLKLGINKDRIYNLVYDNFSYERMQLMGYCLNEKMVLLPKLYTAFISLTREEMKKFGFKSGDSEGFVNLPFSIKNIFITVLFSEKRDHIRISMRSRGDFAVNEFCEKHFDGGGHKNAAGGETKLGMNEAIQKFRNALESYKTELELLYKNRQQTLVDSN
jgi:bifunctional oligoribonuclease and PAP phosphatase NrnA